MEALSSPIHKRIQHTCCWLTLSLSLGHVGTIVYWNRNNSRGSMTTTTPAHVDDVVKSVKFPTGINSLEIFNSTPPAHPITTLSELCPILCWLMRCIRD